MANGLSRTLGIIMRHDRTEALLIFSRSDERANHCVLLRHIPRWRTAHLAQPEQKSSHVCVAAQITEVLRSDEGSIVLGVDEGRRDESTNHRAVATRITWHKVASSEPIAEFLGNRAPSLTHFQSCRVLCQWSVDNAALLNGVYLPPLAGYRN